MCNVKGHAKEYDCGSLYTIYPSTHPCSTIISKKILYLETLHKPEIFI